MLIKFFETFLLVSRERRRWRDQRKWQNSVAVFPTLEFERGVHLRSSIQTERDFTSSISMPRLLDGRPKGLARPIQFRAFTVTVRVTDNDVTNGMRLG